MGNCTKSDCPFRNDGIIIVADFNEIMSYLHKLGNPMYGGGNINPFDSDNLTYRKKNEDDKTEPIWLSSCSLIVVKSDFGMGLPNVQSLSKLENRYIFIVNAVSNSDRTEFWGNASLDTLSDRLFFEQDYETVNISKVSEEFFHLLFVAYAKSKGFVCDKGLNIDRLIKKLKNYRERLFTEKDVFRLIDKAVKLRAPDGRKVFGEKDFSFIMSDYKKSRYDISAQEKDAASAERELSQLIGLADVKEQIKEIVARLTLKKRRAESGIKSKKTHLHMAFLGNPGTAKTTVARLLARILFEKNLIGGSEFREVSRKDLVGLYVGHTSPKVARIFEEMAANGGGLLFIDEAYSLTSGDIRDGFTQEAVSELIRQMENEPDVIVVFAGYAGDLMNDFILSNPGLKSRISFFVDFKDYSSLELWNIMRFHADRNGYKLSEHCQEAAIAFFDTLIRDNKTKNFGNGRMSRKLLEASVNNMATRIIYENGGADDSSTITEADVQDAADKILCAENKIHGADVVVKGFDTY